MTVVRSSPASYLLLSSYGHVAAFGKPQLDFSYTMDLRIPPPPRRIGVVASGRGDGHWIADVTGAVLNHDTPIFGSLTGTRLAAPIVGITGIVG